MQCVLLQSFVAFKRNPGRACLFDFADRCFHCLDGRWIVAGYLCDVWTLHLSVNMLMVVLKLWYYVISNNTIGSMYGIFTYMNG